MIDKLTERGCRDGLEMLATVRRAYGTTLTNAQRRMSEAEAEVTATRALLGLLDFVDEELRDRLARLQEEAGI